MSYRDNLVALAADSEQRVQSVIQRYLDGALTEDEAKAVVIAIIGGANQQAAALASLSLAATLEILLGTPVPVIASAPDPVQDTSRIAVAVAAALALAEPDGGLARIGALGRHEPIGAAATAYSIVIDQSPLVDGWTRQLNPGACEMCQNWARGNRVLPAGTQMLHHTGCTCTQTPITT